jgi:hypothetical protein
MAVRSIPQTPYLLPHQLGLSLALLARRLAYPAEFRRDQRLDLLRGFCVFAMIVDHIGGASWLYGLTGGNSWLVSAAEGFVFLSGLTMGLVYRRKVREQGLRAAARAALRRAGTLYLLTVSVTLIFTLLARLTDWSLWTDRALAAGEPLDLLFGALTLHYTYHGADVLALYTLLVAAAPLVFFLLDEGKTPHVAAGSWLIWAGYQFFPERFSLTWTIQDSNYFPLAAWQVLFVGGLLLGWHRQPLAQRAQRHLAALRTTPALVALGAPALALASVGWVDRGELVSRGFDPTIGLFAKANLGPGRLLLFLAIFLAAYLVLTVCWAPLERALGWLLLPLGQTALYGYTLQLFLVLPLYNLFDVGRHAPERALYNSLFQLVAVLAILAMIRTRFLFRFVPR